VIYVIGGQGFVGSAFARLCENTGRPYTIISRSNYEHYRGSACSVLINANGNSKKFLGQRDPVADFDATVRSVRASLIDFRHDRYVYLSSCDVYPDCSTPATTNENQFIDVARQSPYGFHKYLAEQCVRHGADHHLVFRMGGFVGPGLKKNPIYDILRGGPLWLDPSSELQFLPVDFLASKVMDLVEQKVMNETINICGRGTIALAEVIAALDHSVALQPGTPRVRYEIDLRKIERYGPLPETRESVLAFLEQQQSMCAAA
jgi:nucleoside-diphosphate-sugar epimerase